MYAFIQVIYLHPVATAVFTLAALIISQQFWIAWLSSNDDSDWDETAACYVQHRYYTFWTSLFVAFIGVVASAILIFTVASWADHYVALFRKENLVAVFGVGLLAAIFRHIIDRKIERFDAAGEEIAMTEDSAKGWHAQILQVIAANIWLSWFVISYILTVILTAYGPASDSSGWIQSSVELVAAEKREAKETRLNTVDEMLSTLNGAQFQFRADGSGSDDSDTETVSTSDDANAVTTAKDKAIEYIETIAQKLKDSQEIKPKTNLTDANELLRKFYEEFNGEFKAANELLEKFHEALNSERAPDLAEAKKNLEAAETAHESAKSKKTEAEVAAKGKPDGDPTLVAFEAEKSNLVEAAEDLKRKKDSFELLQKAANSAAPQLELPSDAGDNKSLIRNKLPALGIAVSICLILWFSWYQWVYSQIRTRLREHHRFRGPAVNEFMSLKDIKTPRQLVVIGPKSSGKSELVSQWSGAPWVGETPLPIFHERTQGNTILSICDMPGENLGDQITYLTQYRVDWLVLVVRVNSFVGPEDEPASDKKKRLDLIKRLNTLPSACVDLDRDDPKKPTNAEYTKDYFTALRLLLKQENPDDERVFRHVKNLLLVFNYATTEQESELAIEISESRVKSLAGDIVSRTKGIPQDCEYVTKNVKGEANQLLAVIVKAQSGAPNGIGTTQ